MLHDTFLVLTCELETDINALPCAGESYAEYYKKCS